MTIGLLGVVLRAIIIQRPDIAAVLIIPMGIPEVAHAMIDDSVAAGAAEQGANGKAMDHAGGVVDLSDRIGGLDWPPRMVEIEEAAGRIDDPMLKEVKQA